MAILCEAQIRKNLPICLPNFVDFSRNIGTKNRFSVYHCTKKYRLQRILQFLSKAFMRTYRRHILPRLDAARRMPSSSVALPGKTTVFFWFWDYHVPKRVFFIPRIDSSPKRDWGAPGGLWGPFIASQNCFFLGHPRAGGHTAFPESGGGGRERRLFLEAVPFLRRCEAVSQVKSFLALLFFSGGRRAKCILTSFSTPLRRFCSRTILKNMFLDPPVFFIASLFASFSQDGWIKLSPVAHFKKTPKKDATFFCEH